MSDLPKVLDFGRSIDCPYCGKESGMRYQDTVQTSDSEGEDCYWCSSCGMDYDIKVQIEEGDCPSEEEREKQHREIWGE